MFFWVQFCTSSPEKAARNQSRTLLSLSPLVPLFLLLLSHFLPSAAYRKFRDPLQFSSFCNSIVVDSNRNVPSGKLISWRQEADADDDDRRIRVEKVLGLDRILGLSLSKIWQFGKQFFRKWGIWAIHIFHGHIFHHAAMLVKETEGTWGFRITVVATQKDIWNLVQTENTWGIEKDRIE